jgi:hypothetical protein
MPEPRVEAERDQTESAFTLILRRLFEKVPALSAVLFVDVEGESIDYVSMLPPYDAKVMGAHVHHLLSLLRALRCRNTLGETFGLEVVTDQREIWARSLTREYLLVAVLAAGFDRSELRDALSSAGREFRDEVGLDAPLWESQHERLSVRVRASPGWPYAPEGFSRAGVRVTISDVLGRWTEALRDDGRAMICFRVRTPEGEELTLVHDPVAEDWLLRE